MVFEVFLVVVVFFLGFLFLGFCFVSLTKLDCLGKIRSFKGKRNRNYENLLTLSGYFKDNDFFLRYRIWITCDLQWER